MAGGKLQCQPRRNPTGAAFLQEGDKLSQVDFVSVESESDAATQHEVVSRGFIKSFQEAPPGHGSANMRSASRSTLAQIAVLSGLLWRKHLSDLPQRCAATEHIGRQRVTEHMGSFSRASHTG